MRIEGIELYHHRIPLKKPFKTALRTVTAADNIAVLIRTDEGYTGYGEAPPTLAITGDTNESIVLAIRDKIAGRIVGMRIGGMRTAEIRDREDIAEIRDREDIKDSVIISDGLRDNLSDGLSDKLSDDLSSSLTVEVLEAIQGASGGDTSAKAALDMAVYDLDAQLRGEPLYRALGGSGYKIETDMTISIDRVEVMKQDAQRAVREGFKAIKLKVGGDILEDYERIAGISEAVGPDVRIRLDANQGWSVQDALRLISRIEEDGIDIELIEQPVRSYDLDGMRTVTGSTSIPVMADESLFSPEDAERIIEMEAADCFNIKLMKSGGIYNALRIVSIAGRHGIECMVGSMVESRIGLTAAAHLAGSRKGITKVDLDAALLMAADPVAGGYRSELPYIYLPDSSGLGIERVNGLVRI